MFQFLIVIQILSQFFATSPSVEVIQRRPVQLANGGTVVMDIHSMVESDGRVGVFGLRPWEFLPTADDWDVTKLSNTVGLLRDKDGKWTTIDSPLQQEKLLGVFAARSPRGGFDVLLLLASDPTYSDTAQIRRDQYPASLWYAQYSEGSWHNMTKVTSFDSIPSEPKRASTLVRTANGVAWAVPISTGGRSLLTPDGKKSWGGIILVRSVNDQWHVDTLLRADRISEVDLTRVGADNLWMVFAQNTFIRAPLISIALWSVTYNRGEWGQPFMVRIDSLTSVRYPRVVVTSQGPVFAWEEAPLGLDFPPPTWIQTPSAQTPTTAPTTTFVIGSLPTTKYNLSNRHEEKVPMYKRISSLRGDTSNYPLWLFPTGNTGEKIKFVRTNQKGISIDIGTADIPNKNISLPIVMLDKCTMLALPMVVHFPVERDAPPAQLIETVVRLDNENESSSLECAKSPSKQSRRSPW